MTITDHLFIPQSTRSNMCVCGQPSSEHAYLALPCEGSNLVGHLQWRGDIHATGVMCQMCGEWLPPGDGSPMTVPIHDRIDILAMLDRGDFG